MKTWILDIDGVLSPYHGGLTSRLPMHIHKDWITENVVDSKGKEWVVAIAAPVLDFINEVHSDDLVDIIWHTTWQHDANEVSRIFELPEFPVLDAPEFETWDRRRAQGWWKLPAVKRFLDANHHDVLWTDDDLAVILPKPVHTSGFKLEMIAPDQHAGLTPKHLRQIRQFLEEE